ncbi:hypothetical protein [Solimonas aquatica]|uniref:hypothetical protein n=1 Tax=Solimonas aquatica TaxID=489703 RepID=UPI0015A52FE3|nr:hypothetical protein [Solimonas aquatica]
MNLEDSRQADLQSLASTPAFQQDGLPIITFDQARHQQPPCRFARRCLPDLKPRPG